MELCRERNEEYIKISIIVPIYNVAAYLRTCVGSLVNQTMKEIEIILVNDASPDESEEIMEEYKRGFPELIKCIHLPDNRKQGGARNAGMKIAKGEYILFVDSDDYIDLTMCEKMYQVACAEQSDCVCSGYYMFEKNMREIDLFPDDICGEFTEEKRRAVISTMSVGSVAKLFRRDMWLQNELDFPEQIKYEDLATMPLVWMYINKVSKIDEPLYYYRRHQESTTLEKNSVSTYQIFDAARLASNRLMKRGFGERYHTELEAILIRGFMDEIRFCINNLSVLDMDRLEQMRKYMMDNIANYIENPYFYLKSEPMEIHAAECFIKSLKQFQQEHKNGSFLNADVHYEQYYNLQKKEILYELKKYAELGYRVAVWGAGKKGIDFIRTLDPEHQYIDFIMDKNKNKWGTKIESGHAIYSFEEKGNETDVILVMNRMYFNSIRREVLQKNKRIKLVNLDMFIMKGKLGWKGKWIE